MVLTPVMRRKLAERSKKTKGLVWLPFINNRILGNYTGFDPSLAGGVVYFDIFVLCGGGG
jgi:hypothetical protein